MLTLRYYLVTNYTVTIEYRISNLIECRTFFNQQIFDRSNHRISNIELRIRIFIEWFGNPSLGVGVAAKIHKICHTFTIYSSINYRRFHASSSRTLTIALLLATRILYFGPLRGVMKIQIAVTLVVLRLPGTGEF